MTPEEVKTAAAPEAKPPAKPQEEKQTNCLGCNKQLKKLKIYYRNGKFYCSKRCWRKFMAPKEAK